MPEPLRDAYALVIGIAKYEAVTPLPPSVLRDARAVARVLREPTRCAYPAGNVQLLLGKKATRPGIVDAVGRLAGRLNEKSTVLIYFSGHGGRINSGLLAGDYLLTYDSRIDSAESLQTTGLSGDWLSENIGRFPARKVLVVLDCCHAGGIGEAKFAGSPSFSALSTRFYDQLESGHGRVIIASSANNEVSYVNPRDYHSIFTKHFLAGLSGRAKSSGRVIRVFDLFDYVHPRVTEEEPRQHPLLKATVRDNFPVARAEPLPCPYPGMKPYGSDDDRRFFCGRKQETVALVERIRSSRRQLIIGASGSGKTSLLAAGVRPAMIADHRFGAGEWAVRELDLGEQSAGESLIRELASDTDDSGQGGVKRLLSSTPNANRLLVTVDALERLFGWRDTEKMNAVQEMIGKLCELPDVYVLMTMRADFFEEFLQSRLFGRFERARYELQAMTPEQLGAAIQDPAKELGVTIDSDLVVTLVEEAKGDGDPGLLPWIQETMRLLWKDIDQDYHLSKNAYDELQHQDGRSAIRCAIENHAESVLEEIGPDSESLVRRILMRMVQFDMASTSDGTERHRYRRRQQTEAQLKWKGCDEAKLAGILDRLVKGRLLTAANASEARTYDLVHEAIITGWPRLLQWICEHSEAERIRRKWEERAEGWKHRQLVGQPGGLLDKHELADAQNWCIRGSGQALGCSALLSEFLAKSEEAERKEKYKPVIAAALVGVLLTILWFASTLYAEWNNEQEIMKQLAAEDDKQRGDAGLRLAKLGPDGNIRLAKRILDSDQFASARWLRQGLAEAIARGADEWSQPTSKLLDLTKLLVQRIEGLAASEDVMVMHRVIQAYVAFGATEELDSLYAQQRAKLSTQPRGDGMVLIPKGLYVITDERGNHGPTVRPITDDFYIDLNEVTNDDWKMNMSNAKLKRDDWPEWKERRQDERFASQPLVMVTQKEAIEYCKEKQGKRLPTVDEWQAAARGPWGWTYPWGESVDLARELVKTSAYDDRALLKPKIAASHTLEHFKHDESVFGVRDMAARVYEWTQAGKGSVGAQGASAYADVKHLAPGDEAIDLRSWIGDLSGINTTNFRLSRWSVKTSSGDFDSDLGFRCVKDKKP